MNNTIDFNDASQPIGKRKVAYVNWAIKNGTDPIEAKRQANIRFGFEKKKHLLILIIDLGCSLAPEYVYFGFDLRKYISYNHKVVCSYEQWLKNKDLEFHKTIAKEIKAKYDKSMYEVVIKQMLS